MSATLDLHFAIVTTEGGRRDVWPASQLSPVVTMSSSADSAVDTRHVTVAASDYEQVYDYTEQEQGFMLLALSSSADLDVVIVVGSPATGSLTPANLTASVAPLRASVPFLLTTDKCPTVADAATAAGVDGSGVPLVLSSSVIDGRVYSVWVRNRGTSPAKVRVARRG
ncbi:MAG TPA: hypothetical protein VFF65_12820 [Phycisphaerales bacterium]|nr:hypothetical protein [Phycisphaerales bacterium]